MKLLLTSAGNKYNPVIGRELVKLVGEKPNSVRVLIVSVGSKADVQEGFAKNVRRLVRLGILQNNIILLPLDRKTKDSDLKNVDVIFVCGGNTFNYLDKIQKTGLDTKIKKFVARGGVYFGISAGSYIVCPTIEAAGWKPADRNAIHLKNLRGLNLVPFIVTAHYKKLQRAYTEKMAKMMPYAVISLTDKQAILIKGKTIRVIGAGKRFAEQVF